MAARFSPGPSIGPFKPVAAPPRDPGDQAFLDYGDREVSASKLSQADKNAIWRHIKANEPGRVEFFEDPTVKALMAAGAVPCFPPELIKAARNEAKKR